MNKMNNLKQPISISVKHESRFSDKIIRQVSNRWKEISLYYKGRHI